MRLYIHGGGGCWATCAQTQPPLPASQMSSSCSSKNISTTSALVCPQRQRWHLCSGLCLSKCHQHRPQNLGLSNSDLQFSRSNLHPAHSVLQLCHHLLCAYVNSLLFIWKRKIWIPPWLSGSKNEQIATRKEIKHKIVLEMTRNLQQCNRFYKKIINFIKSENSQSFLLKTSDYPFKSCLLCMFDPLLTNSTSNPPWL